MIAEVGKALVGGSRFDMEALDQGPALSAFIVYGADDGFRFEFADEEQLVRVKAAGQVQFGQFVASIFIEDEHRIAGIEGTEEAAAFIGIQFAAHVVHPDLEGAEGRFADGFPGHFPHGEAADDIAL